MERRTTCAVVLAGGKSSRFPPDKRFILLNGLPLFCHALRVAAAYSHRTYLLVSTGERPVFERVLRKFPVLRRGLVIREDARPYRGPLPALVRFALTSRHQRHTLYVVLPADMPGIHPSAIHYLLSRAEGSADPGVFLFRYRRAVQPFPSVWKRETLLGIRLTAGQKSLSFRQWLQNNRHLIDSSPLPPLPAGHTPRQFFGNVNTVEDLFTFVRPSVGERDDSGDVPSEPR